MDRTNSKYNEDTNYINEKKIKGHGNPITINQLQEILKKGGNAMFKIELSNEIGTGFFFKQNIPTIKIPTAIQNPALIILSFINSTLNG